MLIKSEWGFRQDLNWIITLTARNHTKINIRFKSSKIWDVKLIKSILTIIKKMKRFSDREITFPINVIFKKQRTVSSIKFEIQNVVDILSLIIILNNNRLSRFLLLTRQEISDYMTQKGGIKYWMNFHKCGKFKLNYQRISFKDTLNQKKTDILII